LAPQPEERNKQMKARTVHMTFNTEERRQWIRITEDVQAAVDEASIGEGWPWSRSVRAEYQVGGDATGRSRLVRFTT
jgi:hypothetical protein